MRLLLFILFFSFCLVSIGQSLTTQISDTTPVFSDLHMHLSLKKFYQKLEYDSTLNWKAYNDKVKPILKGKRSTFKNYIEADYAHLDGLNYDIVCESLMPLEKNTVNRSYKRVLNNMGTKIRFRRLKKVNEEANTSFNEMMTQYRFLEMQSVRNPFNLNSTTGFQLVKNKSDLLQARNQGLTAVVLTLEGGNSFYGPINSSNVKTAGNHFDTDSWQTEILANINVVKNFEHKVFYTSLTHFGWTRIAGQGKAIDHEAPFIRGLSQLLSSQGLTHKALHNKWASGLIDSVIIGNRHIDPETCTFKSDEYFKTNAFASRVLDQLLDSTGKHRSPIYIDIRHMDVQARVDYYTYLQNRKGGETIPIIMSHAAVSGENLSYALLTGNGPWYDRYPEVKNPFKFYKRHARKDSCFLKSGFIHDKNITGWFNPWSVNLANEEIPVIYRSNGLIGLIFFDLTLGTTMINYKKRNKKEYTQELLHTNYAKRAGLSEADVKDFYKMESFLRNMFYIVEKSGRSDSTAWNHICVGSDFDSGMDPIDISPTAQYMPHFYRQMIRLIPLYAEINRKESLLFNLSPEEITRKIFHGNMYRFMMRYF
ncbi:hypothetical protein [Lacibacter sp.]|uniref:hypothetical protein n=1 Tax=Lacibacter sp. TaxID=1915409 RepID=UPI002B4B7032|nr:hypothetical protein [Lacibacter sp.]HLP37030.1 hypothetical protein [Lacibacter sp.]